MKSDSDSREVESLLQQQLQFNGSSLLTPSSLRPAAALSKPNDYRQETDAFMYAGLGQTVKRLSCHASLHADPEEKYALGSVNGAS